MYSSDEINACMTEEELFELWKTKDVYNAEYYEGNKKIEFTINHKNVFIADGIISKGQILRSTSNTAPLTCGACNTQPEDLLTTA